MKRSLVRFQCAIKCLMVVAADGTTSAALFVLPALRTVRVCALVLQHLCVRWMGRRAPIGTGRTSGELMLLRRRVLGHVHHVQVLLVVVLLRCGLHILVERRHYLLLYDGDRDRVRCRLLMVHRLVGRWATASRRRLRTRMVLLVRLAGRGRRGWRGRGQILDLARLGRFVEAVRLMERWRRLEGLRVDRRPVRRHYLQRVRRQQWLPSCCRYLHLRCTDWNYNRNATEKIATVSNIQRADATPPRYRSAFRQRARRSGG
uniref:Uncharacterized protein n=1 Tax=Anopheles melas TaxID=34690 RepID=A0A182U2Q6_9DIPT